MHQVDLRTDEGSGGVAVLMWRRCPHAPHGRNAGYFIFAICKHRAFKHRTSSSSFRKLASIHSKERCEESESSTGNTRTRGDIAVKRPADGATWGRSLQGGRACQKKHNSMR